MAARIRIGLNLKEFEMPRYPIDPVPLVDVLPGFGCKRCTFCSRNMKTMQKHVRDHHDVNLPPDVEDNSYEPCFCQPRDAQNRPILFRVNRRDEPRSNNLDIVKQLLSDLLATPTADVTLTKHRTDPVYTKLNWFIETNLRGQIIDAGMLRGLAESPSAQLLAIAFSLIKEAGKIKDQRSYIWAANSQILSNLRERSIKEYADLAAQFLHFLIHLDLHPIANFEVLEYDSKLISDQPTRETVIRLVLQCVEHYALTKVNTAFQAFLMCMCVTEQGYRKSTEISRIAAKLNYFIKACGTFAFDIDKDIGDKFRNIYYSRDYASMGVITVLRRSKMINMSTPAIPVLDERIPGVKILVNNVSVHLKDIHKVYSYCLDKCKSLLTSMFAGNGLPVDPEQIFDQLADRTPGKSLASFNPGLVKDSITALLDKSSDFRHKLFIGGNCSQLDPSGMSVLLDQHDEFIKYLFVLIHLSSLPGRATELQTYTIENGPDIRSVLYFNRRIVLWQRYAKQGAHHEVFRALGSEASELVVHLILHIRPLLKLAYPYHEYSSLFSAKGVPLTDEDLRRIFPRVWQECTLSDLNFSGYRHLARYVSDFVFNKPFNAPNIEDDEDYDSGIEVGIERGSLTTDMQQRLATSMGHSVRTARQIYGNLHNAPGGTKFNSVEDGLIMCDDWSVAIRKLAEFAEVTREPEQPNGPAYKVQLPGEPLPDFAKSRQNGRNNRSLFQEFLAGPSSQSAVDKILTQQAEFAPTQHQEVLHIEPKSESHSKYKSEAREHIHQYVPDIFEVSKTFATRLLHVEMTNNPDAEFLNDHQEYLANSLLHSNENLLSIMPTGTGKTQTMLLAGFDAMKRGKILLVLCPAIALQADILRRSREYRVESSDDLKDFADSQRSGILVLTFEKYFVEESEIRRFVHAHRLMKVIVEEAHTIVTEGDYRHQLSQMSRIVDLRIPIALLTATAPSHVLQYLMATFQEARGFTISRMNTTRRNIKFNVQRYTSGHEVAIVRKILNYLNSDQFLDSDRGIIFFKSKETLLRVADSVRDYWGCKLPVYHGDMDKETRPMEFLKWSQTNRGVILATSAFGVGIDYASIRYVGMIGLPHDFESFVQQSGRAGRDGLTSTACIFYTPQDIQSTRKNAIIKEKVCHSALSLCAFAENTNFCRLSLISNYIDKETLQCKGTARCDVCSDHMKKLSSSFRQETEIHGLMNTRFNPNPNMPNAFASASQSERSSVANQVQENKSILRELCPRCLVRGSIQRHSRNKCEVYKEILGLCGECNGLLGKDHKGSRCPMLSYLSKGTPSEDDVCNRCWWPKHLNSEVDLHPSEFHEECDERFNLRDMFMESLWLNDSRLATDPRALAIEVDRLKRFNARLGLHNSILWFKDHCQGVLLPLKPTSQGSAVSTNVSELGTLEKTTQAYDEILTESGVFDIRESFDVHRVGRIAQDAADESSEIGSLVHALHSGGDSGHFVANYPPASPSHLSQSFASHVRHRYIASEIEEYEAMKRPFDLGGIDFPAKKEPIRLELPVQSNCGVKRPLTEASDSTDCQHRKASRHLTQDSVSSTQANGRRNTDENWDLFNITPDCDPPISMVSPASSIEAIAAFCNKHQKNCPVCLAHGRIKPKDHSDCPERRQMTNSCYTCYGCVKNCKSGDKCNLGKIFIKGCCAKCWRNNPHGYGKDCIQWSLKQFVLVRGKVLSPDMVDAVIFENWYREKVVSYDSAGFMEFFRTAASMIRDFERELEIV